jgi:hypothetical protein
MKRNSIVITLVSAMLYIVLSGDIDGPAHHGHGNVTGATTGATGHCQTSSCHGGNNPLTIVKLQVSDTSTSLPVTTYNALQTYLVTITGDATAISTSLPGFGFQTSAVLGNHTQAGTYVIPTALAGSIHTYPCGATTIVEHTTRLLPITTGVNKYSIQFYWTAPPPASDSVTFYTLLNAVNGDGTDAGDDPNAAPNVTIYENTATATCGTPASVADSAVSASSVFLYWAPVSGAISYKVQYRATAASSWASATATGDSMTITGLLPATTYEFQVQTVCSGSSGLFTAAIDSATTGAATAVPVIGNPAMQLSVYPNPGAGNTTISYVLSSEGMVSMEVDDIIGRKILQIADNELQGAGAHLYHFAISAPGLYYIRLIAGNASQTCGFIKQ